MDESELRSLILKNRLAKFLKNFQRTTNKKLLDLPWYNLRSFHKIILDKIFRLRSLVEVMVYFSSKARIFCFTKAPFCNF